MRIVRYCHICDSPSLDVVLSLGYIPAVNQMQSVVIYPQPQTFYPLDLLFCEKCELGQIRQVIDPEVRFPQDYPYRSGTTKLLVENFKELYEEAKPFLEPNDLVVDIGSNDGTLLRNFLDGGYRVLGIEPTKVALEACDNGIATLHVPFNKEALQLIGTQAKIVTACNVFAHIDGIHELVENIKALLVDDGVFIVENNDLETLVKNLNYDTIYHEHLFYFSLKSLQTLFSMHGMEIFAMKQIPTHGGSRRCFVRKCKI